MKRDDTPTQRQAFISITGQLLRDAEVRVTAGSEPHTLISVEITTGRGMTLWGQQDLGAGQTAHMAAHSKAKLLRQGDWLTLVCAGLIPGRSIREATDVLTCSGVTHVMPARTVREVAA
jgi:hypothetical protein